MTMKNNMIQLECENLDCKKPQTFSFSPSDFSAWIEDRDDFGCQSCGEEFSTHGLRLECHICSAEVTYESGLQEVQHWLQERCPYCAGPQGVDFFSVVVAGSWRDDSAVYDWSVGPKNRKPLERPGRTDYWEGLVHFCSAKEFISIYKYRSIKAANTGAYRRKRGSAGKTNAVCLTETTQDNWEEIRELHGNYGFVFKKRDVLKIGGAPAIYLPQNVFDKLKKNNEKIPETLWPFLNKLKLGKPGTNRRYDYLHEREWRVPFDIEFDELLPYAVVFPKSRPGLPNEELIFKAGVEFRELSDGRWKVPGEY